MPLRALSVPDHLPAPDRRYALERPALELGAGDLLPPILPLYGSLPERSYSKLGVEGAARLLQFFGCETRIFASSTLPLPDQVTGDDHPAGHELRALSMCGMRPTQGRTLAVPQVSAGTQSFNSVNTLRVLGRWMRAARSSTSRASPL
jgi:arsenic resistance protein ArsH